MIKNVKENVVPPIERAEIVQEASQKALNEVIKRSKSINALPEAESIADKKVEVSSGESLAVSKIIDKAVEEAGPYWE